ncbi:MAG: IS1595 family transposase [Methyloceanibacter sp.]|uniref:IS1595 family transposase n=1 Tax=Methyloceanibacter sp. TaxID=1965321 RepID=UPI003D6D8EEB
MTKSVLSDRHFNDDDAAREFLEDVLWPDGPVCPHCGVVGHAYPTSRPGVYRCAEKECRKDFTVTMKTVMERSHIALHKWLSAFYLMASSKKGVSAHQLHRTLGITYRSAWFMAHRIREAMRAGGLVPMGGSGKVVEADETYYGDIPEAKRRKFKTTGRPFQKSRHGVGHKRAIVALIERGGSVRTFHVGVADKFTVRKIVSENVSRESRFHTDESRLYFGSDKVFASHETVKHSDYEYVRGDVHVNSAEGYFAIFKRGMKGIYQHCAEKHLHRYLAEYDFRFNHRIALGCNDGERAALAVKGAEGKRLTYRQPH